MKQDSLVYPFTPPRSNKSNDIESNASSGSFNINDASSNTQNAPSPTGVANAPVSPTQNSPTQNVPTNDAAPKSQFLAALATAKSALKKRKERKEFGEDIILACGLMIFFVKACSNFSASNVSDTNSNSPTGNPRLFVMNLLLEIMTAVSFLMVVGDKSNALLEYSKEMKAAVDAYQHDKQNNEMWVLFRYFPLMLKVAIADVSENIDTAENLEPYLLQEFTQNFFNSATLIQLNETLEELFGKVTRNSLKTDYLYWIPITAVIGSLFVLIAHANIPVIAKKATLTPKLVDSMPKKPYRKIDTIYMMGLK